MPDQLVDYRPFVLMIDISDPYTPIVESVNRFGLNYEGTSAYGFDYNGGFYTIVQDTYDCDGNYYTRFYKTYPGGSSSYQTPNTVSLVPSYDYGEYGADIIIKENDAGKKALLANTSNFLSMWQEETGIGFTSSLPVWRGSTQTSDGHYIYAGGGFAGYLNIETGLPQTGGTFGFYVDNPYSPQRIADGDEGTGWYDGWQTMAPRDYAISGNWMFLTSHYDDEFFNFPKSHGFSIVHILDRENPQLEKWVNKPLDGDLDEPQQVLVHKGYAYVCCHGSDKILIYDVNQYYEWDIDWIAGLEWNKQALLPNGELPYFHDFGDVSPNSRVFGEELIIQPSPDPIAWHPVTDSYGYRQKITISNYELTNDVENYPVGLHFETGDSIFDHTRSDGYDVRFTDVDGNELDFERGKWDDGVEATFWVSCTVNSGTTTTFYMYYGYADASDASDTAVWDNVNYDIVYHFEDGPYDGTAGEIGDATSNNRGAHRYSTSNWQVASGGPFGDYANMHYPTYSQGGKAELDATFNLPSSYTISSMFKVPWSDHGSWHTLTRGNSYHHIILENSTHLLGNYKGNFHSSGYDFDNLEDGWHHVAVVRNASDGKGYFYVDGEYVGVADDQPDDDIIQFGGWDSGQIFGAIDEFRVINEEQSADWLKLEGNNLADYDNFVTIGNEQASTDEGPQCIETYLYWDGVIVPPLPSTTGWTAEVVAEQGASAATITNFTTDSFQFRVTCADLIWGTGYQVKLTQDDTGWSVRSNTITVSRSLECNEDYLYLCDNEDICNALGGTWWLDAYYGGWCFE